MKNFIKVLMLVLIALVSFSCATTAPAVPIPEGEYIVIEAESGALDPVWMLKDSETASGGKYIYTDVPKNKPAEEVGFNAVYKFNVAKAGTYLFYARAKMFDEKNTSYYFNVNNTWTIRTDFQYKKGWLWGSFNDDNPLRPEMFELAAGENTITVYHREPNVYLDKMIVSNVEGLGKDVLDSIK